MKTYILTRVCFSRNTKEHKVLECSYNPDLRKHMKELCVNYLESENIEDVSTEDILQLVELNQGQLWLDNEEGDISIVINVVDTCKYVEI